MRGRLNKMTLIKPIGGSTDQDDNLRVAEQLFAEAGVILGDLLSRARQEDFEAAGRMKVALKELSDGCSMASRERQRVLDERRKTARIVGSYGIDFAAARDEIGRRLACLRDARNG
ncbi:MAG: hypothetical protein GY717_03705 [Rhodobacteraceae bacterium]|nr:hypothetical protein [Paracoccaceae bacterium]